MEVREEGDFIPIAYTLSRRHQNDSCISDESHFDVSVVSVASQ